MVADLYPGSCNGLKFQHFLFAHDPGANLDNFKIWFNILTIIKNRNISELHFVVSKEIKYLTQHLHWEKVVLFIYENKDELKF